MEAGHLGPQEEGRNVARFERKIIPDDIEISRADAGDVESAKKLIRLEYESEGYGRKGEDIPISNYLDLPGTTTLVAKNGSEVVGTVSIVSGEHLPMETLYKEELKKIREKGDTVAEVCQLATKREDFALRDRWNILMKLFKSVLEESRSSNIDDLVIAINPRHESFYKSVGFKDLGGLKTYEAVHAPALAKVLEVRSIPQARAVQSNREIR